MAGGAEADENVVTGELNGRFALRLRHYNGKTNFNERITRLFLKRLMDDDRTLVRNAIIICTSFVTEFLTTQLFSTESHLSGLLTTFNSLVDGTAFDWLPTGLGILPDSIRD